MNASNLQLRTIILSQTTPSSFLVYDKKDKSFYNVGSPDSLDKRNFETKRDAITLNIKNFINDNAPYFDSQILTNYRDCLQKRIKKIEGQTTGFWAFIIYFFNPEAKICLLDEKKSLEDLTRTINSAFATQINSSSQSPSDENAFISQSPSVQYEFTPIVNRRVQQLIGNLPAKVNSPLKRSHLNKVQEESSFFTTPTSPLRHKEPHSDTQHNSTIPPSPPPPMSPFFTPTQVQYSSITLPNEPVGLSFEVSNYKKLSHPEILKQIDEIDKYVNNSNLAFAPFQKIVKDHLSLTDEIKTTELQLSEYETQLNQCEENRLQLKNGLNKGDTVFLYYKQSHGFTEIPFYPETLEKIIESRSQVLEQERINKLLVIKNQITAQEHIVETLTTELSNGQMREKDEALSLETQKQAAEDVLQQLQTEADKLSQSNSIDKGCFQKALTLSEAENQYETIIDDLKDNITINEQEVKDLYKKRQSMETDCQKSSNLDLATLEKILEKKMNFLNSLLRHKNSRISWMKQKGNQGKTLAKTARSQQPSQIVQEYPLVQWLNNIPAGVRILLKGAGMQISGSSDLRSNLYGLLFAKKD